MIDATTKLAGADDFQKRLELLAVRCADGRSPLALLLLDVDGMGRINEVLGREAGDRVMSNMGAALRSATHAPNELFRYPGDAFAIIMPGADASIAWEMARDCRLLVSDPGHRPRATVSIGVSELTPGHPVNVAVVRAELALSRAQESGGDGAWRSDDPRRHGLNPISLAEELTDREWAIVGHLVRRRTEQDIAERMGIKTGTVRSHKARIRRKLHVQPDAKLTEFASEYFTQAVDARERAVDARERAVDDLRVVDGPLPELIDLRD